MTLQDRLRQIATALPSETSSVTFTRADLIALVDDDVEALDLSMRDMTIADVALEMDRATSTVRTWLISGALKGYKLNNRDWRVPRAALRDYVDAQSTGATEPAHDADDIDIGAWRKLRA